MRLHVALTLTIGLFGTPALADRIEGQAITRHATVFQQGAAVDWTVDISAAPGRHELIIPGFPAGIDSGSLNLLAEGAQVGSVAVQTARSLPSNFTEPQPVADARANVAKAREALIASDAEIAAARAEAEGLREQNRILRDLTGGDTRLPQTEWRSAIEEAGQLIAANLGLAVEADAKAERLAISRDALQRNLDTAEAALAAVLDADAETQTLVIALDVENPNATLKLSAFTDQASWSPTYDIALDRKSGQMTIERNLNVSQSSGVDWKDVTLTLSTARPGAQSSPSEVASYFPKAFNPEDRYYSEAESAELQAAPALRSQVMDDESAGAGELARSAEAVKIGALVVYEYPSPVTIRNAADSLQLVLDQVVTKSNVFAEASPRFDSSAFVIAEGKNDSEAPILPGQSTLYLDGAMVGRAALPLIASGDDLRLGFGPIDGMTAEFRLPEEQQGDRGIITTRNQLKQREELIIRNLTSESWPLRVVDRAPVSTQGDLKIAWSASPEPTTQDPDGRRGILYWEQQITAGADLTIEMQSEITWPDGQRLRRE